MIRLKTQNYNERAEGQPIDMLVLHYTGMESFEEARDRLLDPSAEVSAHYLINEDGTCYQLVDEDKRAWHAGVSSWQGKTDINSRSIGIELVNPGHEFGYSSFPKVQIESLMPLCLDILSRHQIPPRNIVGHSDVAPTRKTDPGELFPWQKLAAAGIGLWPHAPLPPTPVGDAPHALSEIGYQIDGEEALNAAIVAFKRHFMPDSNLSEEVTVDFRLRLQAILDLIHR